MAIIVLFGSRRSRRPRIEILRSRSSGTASITIQELPMERSWSEVVKCTCPGCVPAVEQCVERASAM